MTVSLRELARECGVSAATVSNILRNRGGTYSQRTRERVLGIAQHKGYRPSQLASSLRTRRTPAVGVLVPLLCNAYNSELLHTLTRALARRGLEVMIAAPPSEEREESRRSFHSMLSWRPQALVMMAHDAPDLVAAEDLERAVKSTVMISLHGNPWPQCSAVFPRRQALAQLAVDHLADLGHRRIGMLNYEPDESEKKKDLVRQALAARGLELRDEDVWGARSPERMRENGDERSWFELGRRFAERADRPTAMVARVETIATRFISGFTSVGGRVPRDLSVAAFNSSRWASMAGLPLTTVGAPVDRLVEATIELMNEGLAARAQGREVVRQVMVEPELVVRDSTGPCP